MRFVVKVLNRDAETKKEDGVDDFLHAQALRAIAKSRHDEDKPGTNTLVLVTGFVQQLHLFNVFTLLSYELNQI